MDAAPSRDGPRVNSQINVLNQAYAGSTGGAPTAFQFQLQSINRVTNTSWYPIVSGSSAERSMKSSLRQGGKNTLNMYLGALSGGLLGRIEDLGDSFVTVEIADRVSIKVQRGAITAVLPKGTLKSA